MLRLTQIIHDFAVLLAICVGLVLSGCSAGSGDITSSDPGATPGPAPAPIPAPMLNFSASPTTVNAGGFSTLTWTSSNTTGCVASGAWSGSRAISGSQSVGPINAVSTYTLTCSGTGGNVNRSVTVQTSGTGRADLNWSAPTTNEDGSPASLSGFNIYQGSSSTNLQRIATIASAATLTYTVSNLATGTHYFAVTAVGSNGAESAYSSIASKTIP